MKKFISVKTQDIIGQNKIKIFSLMIEILQLN